VRATSLKLVRRGDHKGSLTGRFFEADRHSRRGGDACVAHGGRCDTVAQQDGRDASVMIHYLPVKAPLRSPLRRGLSSRQGSDSPGVQFDARLCTDVRLLTRRLYGGIFCLGANPNGLDIHKFLNTK
jgi:hypothetical protein